MRNPRAGPGSAPGTASSCGGSGTLLVVELEGRVSSVAGRVEGRSLDEPGVAPGPIKPANWPGMIRPVLWISVSGRTTAGGKLLRGAVSAPATAAIEGQSPGRGALGSNPEGRSDRPVSMMWWPAEWSFEPCVSDRTSAQRWLRSASRGRCSQISIPGVLVAIGRNSPRISAGASGLRSKLSSCDNPPERKM